jgi:HD-GYP domain-containing protein (c-di-GMP phosphodiesterase class II)
MMMDDEMLKELEITGLMHDIGKIAINNNILNKPGKLTLTEYEEIKRHPEISYHILKSADVYIKLAEYVLSHHERWDGKGYPRGISGEDIPFVARIITVADAYEAMTANRPYREPFTQEEAIAELKRCSGTQFDPDIVQACEKYCWMMNGVVER